MNNKIIKKGDIFLYDFGVNKGSVQNSFRPAVVLQTNTINNYSTTFIIAPITTVIKKSSKFFHVYLGQCFGLDMPSMVLVEQITTVSGSELKNYIGTINDWRVLRTLDEALLKIFGLQKKNQEPTSDVRCLCKKHCDEYRMTDKYILKRLNPEQVVKEKCDKCGNLGYDYMLIDKKIAFRRRNTYGG